MMTCKLSEIVSPAFSEPHRALKSGAVNQLVLKGGRGSAKSSYASVEGWMQLLRHPEIHAAVLRKVGNTLRASVYAQYIWAAEMLGIFSKIKATVSPMEITYKPTGQKIMFLGADDPGKLKSLKVPFGYLGLLHFEELDQFAGPEEIRNIEQSVLRGGPIAVEFKVFNPPRTRNNWANEYVLTPEPGQLIHHSTFLETPSEWLGPTFLAKAEHLMTVNPAAYEHEYLGKANGTGGAVFENVASRQLTDADIAMYERVQHGVDFGWFPDPWAYVKCHYKASTRTLYIFAEAREYKANNRKTADILASMGAPTKAKPLGFIPALQGLSIPDNPDVIICDSAEPKSIGDYNEYGLKVLGAEKPAGSLDYSMKWLQGLTEIVIDPVRCPETLKEFIGYEYERTRDGKIISGYPDKDNHHIDATRYATNLLWRRPGK